MNPSGQNYGMYKFSNITIWNQSDIASASDKTSIVYNLSDLNWTIYDQTFFQGIRVRFNFIDELSTQINSNELVYSNDLEIPITSEIGYSQTIYFNPPIIYDCSV